MTTEIMDNLFERLASHSCVIEQKENNCGMELELNNGAVIYYEHSERYFPNSRSLSVRLTTGEVAFTIRVPYQADLHPDEERLEISLDGLPFTLPDTSEAPQIFALVFTTLGAVMTHMATQKTRQRNGEVIG